MFKEGDYIVQDRGDDQTYGVIVLRQKNGSWTAVAYDTWRNRAFLASIRGWYPAPQIIDKDSVPAKALEKIGQHLTTLRNRIKGRIAQLQEQRV